MFDVLTKKKLGDKVWLMDVYAPLIAAKAMPGQFMILRCDADGERIPLTVCDYDRDSGRVTIVFLLPSINIKIWILGADYYTLNT